MSTVQLSWVKHLTEESLSVCVSLDLYPLEALFRVCYLFTDRCYLFLSHDETAKTVEVRLSRRAQETDLNAVAGEFANELINQKVRLDIAAETGPIRELIVAQAFAEADLLNRSASEASYIDDPKGVAK